MRLWLAIHRSSVARPQERGQHWAHAWLSIAGLVLGLAIAAPAAARVEIPSDDSDAVVSLTANLAVDSSGIESLGEGDTSIDSVTSTTSWIESSTGPAVDLRPLPPFVENRTDQDPRQNTHAPLGPVVDGFEPEIKAELVQEPVVAVRFAEREIFEIGVARAGLTTAQRAREISETLARAFAATPQAEVLVEEGADMAVVLLGSTPIVQLTREDVRFAHDANLTVHAAAVAAKIRGALERERARANLAQTVFSVAMVVFLALLAVFFMRRMTSWAEDARRWLHEKGDDEPALRMRDIEVLSPATTRSAILLGIGIGRLFGYGAIVYTWLIVSLSLFVTTRGYTERLTGFIVAPLSELVSRVVSSLPIVVVVLLAASAVFVLVRFIGLFFASVPKQTHAFGWLPGDLAPAASVVVRLAVVVTALVFGAPLVTGNPDGALSRLGVVVVVICGCSTLPILTAALLGAIVVFARRLHAGDFVEWRGQIARVDGVGLVQTRLIDGSRAELRLPTFMLLMSSIRVHGRRRPVFLDLEVAAHDADKARQALQQVGDRYGAAARVDLLRIVDGRRAFRLRLTTDVVELESGLVEAIEREVTAQGVTVLRLETSKVAL